MTTFVLRNYTKEKPILMVWEQGGEQFSVVFCTVRESIKYIREKLGLELKDFELIDARKALYKERKSKV